MRLGRDLAWIAMTLAAACAACGDSGGSAPPAGSGAPLSAADVRGAPAGADSSGPSGRAASAADSAATTGRTGPLYAVQVGAFVRDGNAAALEKTLQGAGLPVWTPSAEVDGRSFDRVRVGAAKSVTDARRLAGRLRKRLGSDVWVAPVAPDETVPRDVVTGTTKALNGS